MASRILVQPAEDYFVAFLSTRGITLNAENPEVIHYFGTSKRQLKKLVKELIPDFVVIHCREAFDENYKFSFCYDEVKNDRDIYVARPIMTNAPGLAKLHYQSLGLERIVNDIAEEKEEKKKRRINMSAIRKVLTDMMWN